MIIEVGEQSEYSKGFSREMSEGYGPDDALVEDGALDPSHIDDYQLPYSKELHDILCSPTAEFMITLLVFASCGLIALETIRVRLLYYNVEDAISLLFITEYLVRWYTRQLKPSYLLKWEMVVDFLAFLPFLMQAEGVTNFTFLRLLRILRLQRFLRDPPSFQRLVSSIPILGDLEVRPLELQVARIFTQIFTLLFITSGLMYNAEHAFNPALRDYFSAFYFSLTTLTTVGFGDIVPVTPLGKTTISCSILVGIALIPYQLSQLAQLVIDGNKADKKASKKGNVQCTVCGEDEHVKKARFCFRCGQSLQRFGTRRQGSIVRSVASRMPLNPPTLRELNIDKADSTANYYQ